MPSPQPVNILLVDDHPQNLLALSAILENPEYNLVTAPSGPQALSFLLKQDFAVILLDVMMPEMDGFQVATTIRSREKTRGIPIIFVTAVAKDLSEVYRGYSVGGVDYIQKPLDPAVVRAKVAVFVELYRSKEEIKRQADLIQKSERARFLEVEQAARQRAEIAEKRYYELINWVDHAVLWEYDTKNFRFSFVSHRSAKIVGFSYEDWLANPDFFFSRIPQDDVKTVRQLFDAAVEEGKDGRVEHRFINKSGEQIWLHTGVNPRKDSLGQVTLLWGLSLDITPFKSAEEKQRFLAQASHIFSSSLDYHATLQKVAELAVPVISDWCTVDITEDETWTRIISVQGRPELKRRAEEIQKKHGPRPLLKLPIVQAIATGKPALFRAISDSDLKSFAQSEEHLRLLRDAGFQSMMVAPLNARGKTFGAVTFSSFHPHRRYSEMDLKFAEDLAWHAAQAIDNSRLYGEAQKAIRLRESVLGIVSHDLKNPLTAIAMNLQVIASGAKGDPKTYAQRALRSIDRMDRMIRDLLDLGKIEEGHVTYDIKTCSANTLVSEVLELMQPIAAAGSVTISWPKSQEDVQIACDRDRIEQVLSNVVGNAIKFSAPGSAVRVGLKVESGEVGLSISDSGPGISIEELPHVFEPYWQAPSGRRKEGTGLGLYISKRIVEAHGGRIWVDSERGIGTSVHFTLPQAVPAAAAVSKGA